MTKQLVFGTLGPTGYFTAYTTKDVKFPWSGYVADAFEDNAEVVYYLDDKGKMVSEDAFSHVLKAIPIWNFIYAALDDNGETEGEQWGDLPAWAATTDFGYVMVQDV